MANTGSYPIRSFSENQTFLVYEPSTSTTARVRGSDLVNYITPSLNYAYSEPTRDAALTEDYQIGQIVITGGGSALGDGGNGTFLVVEGGSGDYPMLNGNDLLILPFGDLSGSDVSGSLVTYSEGTETTASAFNAFRSDIDQRMTYVDSVEDLSSIASPIDGAHYNLTGYNPGSDIGGGVFYWDSSKPKSDHDGLYVFSNTVPWTSVLTDYKTAVGETDPTGNGCFVKLMDSIYLADLGLLPVSDIVNDPEQTSDVIAQIDLLPETFDGVIICEEGYKFDLHAVTPSLPPSCSLQLSGAQAAFISAGYRIKKRGIVSSDLVDDDMINVTESGHHPAMELSNTGTSGSGSAGIRLASLLYRTPQDSDPAEGRVTGQVQFSEIDATQKWGIAMRPYKPWLAVSNGYAEWTANEIVANGDIRYNGDIFYQARNSGDVGTTPPTHSQGDVTYGAVTWRAVLDTSSARFVLHENGAMGIGAGVGVDEAVRITAPKERPNVVVAINANTDGAVSIIPSPKDSGGSIVSSSRLRWVNNGIGGFEAPDTTRLLSADVNGAFWGRKKHLDVQITGTTPNVGSAYSFYFNEGSPITVTDLVGSINNQEIQISNRGSANITLSGPFILEGGTSSVVLTQYSIITLRRISAVTGSWVEVSRSIK